MHLSHAASTDDQGRALANIISSNSALVEVNPGGSLSSASLRALSNKPSLNPSPENLGLRIGRQDIPEASVISFVDSLATNKRLKKLNISKNVLTSETWH